MAGETLNAVGFVGNANDHAVHALHFESSVELLTLGNRRAVVFFAGHDERRSFDLGDEIGEGAVHVVIGFFPGIRWEPIFGGPGNVRGEDEAVPVDDRIEDHGGTEAIGVLDHPTGKHTAAAATGNEQIVGIDIAFGDDRVDTAVHVVEIVAGIGVVNEVAKFRAVAGAAAWIGI